MPVCPECGSYKLDQLNDKWWMGCRDCGTTFRLYPAESFQDIHRAVIETLMLMEEKFRIKGDDFHADKLEKFRLDYLADLTIKEEAEQIDKE